MTFAFLCEYDALPELGCCQLFRRKSPRPGNFLPARHEAQGIGANVDDGIFLILHNVSFQIKKRPSHDTCGASFCTPLFNTYQSAWRAPRPPRFDSVLRFKSIRRSSLSFRNLLSRSSNDSEPDERRESKRYAGGIRVSAAYRVSGGNPSFQEPPGSA